MIEREIPLEEEIAGLLKEKNLKITCAESCTGGLLSGRLVNVAGISDYYEAGIVTYSNEAKNRFLGVENHLLDQYGAVSSQVAEAMAIGAAKFAGADVAVAVTGIAGPGGGTKYKPVGLVFMACFVKGTVVVREHHFTGDRQQVRQASVEAALTLVKECLS